MGMSPATLYALQTPRYHIIKRECLSPTTHQGFRHTMKHTVKITYIVANQSSQINRIDYKALH